MKRIKYGEYCSFFYHFSNDTSQYRFEVVFSFISENLKKVLGNHASIKENCEIEYDKKECCSICFEEFGDEDIQQCELTCKNVFHTECINLWLASNNSCPLCRSNWITSTSDNPLEEFKGLSI